jgi:hypothetical protein
VSDRIHSLTVVLERDIRDDDLQPVIDAIGMVRGVLRVKKLVADPTSYMAISRARMALIEKLNEALREEP